MNQNRMSGFLKKYWWSMGLLCIGGVLMIGGIWMANKQTKGNTLVIMDATPLPEVLEKVLVVDVEGSVIQPGVLRLPLGSRVADALIAAGGLSAQADRSYVTRFVNQAELIKDGSKLYIPELGEQTDELASTQSPITNQNKMVSINSASESELDGLWGVGSARAKSIIDNRPYGSFDELVSKAQIPQSVIDKNKEILGL